MIPRRSPEDHMSEKSKKEELICECRMTLWSVHVCHQRPSTCPHTTRRHTCVANYRHSCTTICAPLPYLVSAHWTLLRERAGRMDDSLVSGLCTLASLCCVLGSRFARSSVVPLGTFYLSESSVRRKTLRVTIAVAAPGSLRFARDSKCVSSSTRSSLPSSLTWNQFNVT